MFNRLLAFVILAAMLFAIVPSPASAATPDAALTAKLKADLAKYLASRAKAEHISAISLSVSLPGSASNINTAVGTTQYGGAGAPVTPANLYQIGSITKSFTSVAILQLEAEGKLNIDQTVGKWLPQYPAWKNITIRRLLDMTSDIPTYDDEQPMLKAYAANPSKYWTTAQLVAFVYPKLKPGAGWLYSNTAYLLSEMIVERASGRTYTNQIHQRFLSNPALGLKDTYYSPNLYPASVTDRMVAGYFFSNDPGNAGLQPLYGKDMRPFSVSWAQGAGAIVSTPQDVTRWARALYEGPLLAAKQRTEMMSVVSLKNGKPIPTTTAQDPRGFGLGVADVFMPGLGRFWFYEGETLGYRMVYGYFPKSRVVVAVGLNSQPNGKQDAVGKLMQSIFATLRAAGKM